MPCCSATSVPVLASAKPDLTSGYVTQSRVLALFAGRPPGAPKAAVRLNSAMPKKGRTTGYAYDLSEDRCNGIWITGDQCAAPGYHRGPRAAASERNASQSRRSARRAFQLHRTGG